MPSNIHQSILVKAINEYIGRGYRLFSLGQRVVPGYKPDAIVENNHEVVIIESVVSSFKPMNLDEVQPLFPKPVRVDKRGKPCKFIQSLHERNFNRLQEIANERGITIQELIRAVIIPDWLKQREKK